MSTHAERLRVIEEVTEGFDRHDLEAIMTHFADDAIFDWPRGRDPWGGRVVGKEAIREAFSERFSSIPDVRYTDARHLVDGDRGASEWLVTGTTVAGQRIEARGCDLWEFRGDKIVRKDSYWKMVEP